MISIKILCTKINFFSKIVTIIMVAMVNLWLFKSKVNK